MVLFRRKPIDPPASPREYPLDQEVWVLQATGEVFGTYEQYCARYDYYMRKAFTCEVTGHRHLTFFDALISETEGAAAVESKFPEILREPVLRKVQHSTISRIDELVNSTFDSFKEDFFPGEEVISMRADNGDKVKGVIRDKIVFNETKNPDGSLLNGRTVRYFIQVEGEESVMAVMDSDHIARSRKNFSKQMLRSFLRNSVHRERWDGAPWQVKDDLAQKYNIPTAIPANLQFEFRMAERKANLALKKGKLDEESLEFFVDNNQMDAILPTLKSQKTKIPRRLVPKLEPQLRDLSLGDNANDYPALKGLMKGKRTDQAPALPKYPMEDLELSMKRDGITRPRLKFLSAYTPTSPDTSLDEDVAAIEESSVGGALEAWSMLNAYADFFVIDSFTFDDFIEALSLPSTIECELVAEMHCALLKKIVNPNGDVEVELPETPKSSTQSSRDATPEVEEEDADEDDEDEPTDMVTRSKKNKMSKAETSLEVDGDAPIKTSMHKAEEMQTQEEWEERIKLRDFAQGGWQMALVGLLYQMSGNPKQKNICDQILAHLAPLDQRATAETVRKQYASLGINLRIAALEILVVLSVQANGLKDYIKECEVEMTKCRGARADFSRAKKGVLQELEVLENERKLNRPDIPAEEEPVELPNGDSHTKTEVDTEGDTTMNGVDLEEEDEEPRRGARGRAARASALKRKREEPPKPKETEAQKQEKKYQKILNQIEEKKEEVRELEGQVAKQEALLQENSRHRIKTLGRDRFWNRYFWFERNAMPIAGNETSSTAENGYANACIWVQGPDHSERYGFLEYVDPFTGKVDEVELSAYKKRFGCTPRERQEVEEGDTHVLDSHQFGYLDDVNSLDSLIGYLDERGEREKELRKELQILRVSIAEQMKRRAEHFAAVEARKAASEEPVIGIATRKKTNVDLSTTRYPCLAWRNDSARRLQNGRIHSQGTNARKLNKAAAKAKEAAAVVFGKRETRRGTRF